MTVVNVVACTYGLIVSGYRAPASSTRMRSSLPATSSQVGSSCPFASRAVNPLYRSAVDLSFRSVRLRLPGSTEAARLPDIANASVSGLPLAAVGRRSSVKPCSRPLGPFTYHSVSAPRLYSTRFAAPPGLVRGAFRSLSPYPYARRSMPHSSAPFRKLTPAGVKSAVTPRPAFVMRRPSGPATKWYADKSFPITDETCACATGESVLTAARWSTPVARIEWIGVP